MKGFAKVLLPVGLLLIAVSIWLNTINQPGSPEAMVGWVNVGLGVVMLLVSVGFLAYGKHKEAQGEEKQQTESEGKRK